MRRGFDSRSPTTERISPAGRAGRPPYRRRRPEEALPRSSGFRCACTRRAVPTPACTPPQVAHVDVPEEALSHAYPRQRRPGDAEFAPLVRRLAKFLPRMSGSAVSPVPQRVSTPGSRRCAAITPTAWRCPRAEPEPQQRRFVTVALRPLDVDATEAHRQSSWDCTTLLRSAATAPARRPSVTFSVWTGFRRRSPDRLCQRGRLLLVHGALTGRRSDRGGGGQTRTGLVRNAIDGRGAFQ